MKINRVVLLICLIAVPMLEARAAAIHYDVDEIAPGVWEYQYELSNLLAIPIEEFTIFFALDDFANLEVSASPDGWDSIVAQPDDALPTAGFFDSLALQAALLPGEQIGGFGVRFSFLGTGTPGPQQFLVVDPETFDTLAVGMSTAQIPLPGGILFLTSGILALLKTAGRHNTSRLSG